MDIIHGAPAIIPGKIHLEMLAKIASIAHHLGCQEALGGYPSAWVAAAWAVFPPPTAVDRSVVLWIFILTVFHDPEKLRSTTRMAIIHWTNWFNPLGLDIPKQVLDWINTERQRVLYSMLFHIRHLVTRLQKREVACPLRACSAMRLGLLHQQLPVQYFVATSVKLPISISIAKVVVDVTELEHDRWATFVGKPWNAPSALGGTPNSSTLVDAPDDGTLDAPYDTMLVDELDDSPFDVSDDSTVVDTPADAPDDSTAFDTPDDGPRDSPNRRRPYEPPPPVEFEEHTCGFYELIITIKAELKSLRGIADPDMESP
ncbi:hypothetical protein SAMD00023353_0402310 [Rosellinia necatrix]|uniref:Uncharacterized protein n=1 Tax=Rosellinia necatrix TaxID=77044 RepID=A0A1S8A5F8_ROSNE|nr:hypothetical protein SAMD00023353_0402310 [Rosellinia necatrix]